MMQSLKSIHLLRRSSARLGSVFLLGGCVFAAACETSQFCAEDSCEEDGGGGAKPTGGKPGSGGKAAVGGKPNTSGSGGLGGAMNGAGGALGGMAGSDATGGKAAGSGGQVVDPGELDGSVAKDLVDVLAGGSVKVLVSLERTGGFEGTVLVSLDGEPFSAAQVFAGASENEIELTLKADAKMEQGYYEASVIAESTDGVLSVEIPLNIRVRGAPGTLDLTFGDREIPWVGEGTQAEVAIDDAGFIYLRNQSTIFRFDQRGVLDESFEPEGLADELGPMIGMEDGVLVGVGGTSTPSQVVHIRGSGKRNPTWTGSLLPDITLGALPWSLHRRDDRVVVAAEYSYPFSNVELFSSAGTLDPSLGYAFFYGSGFYPLLARLDSQGRVIVAPKPGVGAPVDGAPVRRLLPNGSLDTSFADEGELALSGTNPTVGDFEVLSDDGLAILVISRIFVWTPSDSGGVVQDHELGLQPRSILALPNDEILALHTTGLPPEFLVSRYARSGELVPFPGHPYSVNLNDLFVESDPDAMGYLGVVEPVYDKKSHRIIITATIQYTQRVWSMWL